MGLLLANKPTTAAAKPLALATSPSTARTTTTSTPHQLVGITARAAAATPAILVPAELRVLLSNRSLAFLKAGRAAAAAEDAASVIALSPQWAKGHWRLGKALVELNRCGVT